MSIPRGARCLEVGRRCRSDSISAPRSSATALRSAVKLTNRGRRYSKRSLLSSVSVAEAPLLLRTRAMSLSVVFKGEFGTGGISALQRHDADLVGIQPSIGGQPHDLNIFDPLGVDQSALRERGHHPQPKLA